MSSYSNSSYSAPVDAEPEYTNSQIEAARLLVQMRRQADQPVEAHLLVLAAQPLHRRALSPEQRLAEVEAMMRQLTSNPPPNGWHWEANVVLECIRAALDGEIDQ